MPGNSSPRSITLPWRALGMVAPGNATRYHATLINAAPSEATIGTSPDGTFRTLVITIDLFTARPTRS